MSTAAQINANQLNAQSSTGPRTAEGKSVVAQNATKHGLTATYPVIRTPEEQTQFDGHFVELGLFCRGANYGVGGG